jgi:O-antigen ligase
MLGYRLRRNPKPLRFVLGDALTAIHGLYAFLGLWMFYGLWSFFVIPFFGYAFLGVYGRPLTVGLLMLTAAVGVQVLAETRYRRMTSVPLPGLVLGFVFVLAVLALAMGLLRGWEAQNPLLRQYRQGMVIFAWFTILVFYAVNTIKDAVRISKIMAYFLAFLAILDLIAVIIRFLPFIRLPLQTLEYQYVAPLAASYFLIKYLREKISWKNIIILSLTVLGCISEFQKPVVVPLFFTMLFTCVFIGLFYSKNLQIMTIIKKLLLLGLIVISFVVLLDIILPTNFLSEYLILFYKRYLKINPNTGEQIESVFDTRLDYYVLAWESIKENRWFGGGVGASFTHPYIMDRYAFPHSIILDFMLSYGIFGLLSLFLFIIFVMFYVIKYVNWRENPVEKAAFGSYLLFAFLVSLVGFFWGHLPMVYTTAIALGTLLKVAVLDAQARPHGARPGWRLRLRAFRPRRGRR